MTSCSHFIQIFWRQFLQHILDLVQFLALRRPQMSPTAYWPIPCPWPPINCKQQPQTKQSPPHHTKIVYQSLHSPLTLRNPKDGIPYHGVKKYSDPIRSKWQLWVAGTTGVSFFTLGDELQNILPMLQTQSNLIIRPHTALHHKPIPQLHLQVITVYSTLDVDVWQRYGSSPIAAILNILNQRR